MTSSAQFQTKKVIITSMRIRSPPPPHLAGKTITRWQYLFVFGIRVSLMREDRYKQMHLQQPSHFYTFRSWWKSCLLGYGLMLHTCPDANLSLKCGCGPEPCCRAQPSRTSYHPRDAPAPCICISSISCRIRSWSTTLFMNTRLIKQYKIRN